MVKIKFEEGPHFQKLPLIKYVYQECRTPENTFPSLREAKQTVESGVIECPEPEYHNTIKMIEEYGGIVITNNGMKSLSNAIADAQVCMLTKSEEKKVEPKAAMLVKPNKNGTGLIIESSVPISEHVFKDLEKNYMAWAQIVTSIPFVVGLTTQFCENKTNEFWSLLAVEVPESHNTINEITSLSKIVDEIHTEIIATVYKSHNIAKDLNSFIDDINVETRSDSHN